MRRQPHCGVLDAVMSCSSNAGLASMHCTRLAAAAMQAAAQFVGTDLMVLKLAQQLRQIQSLQPAR